MRVSGRLICRDLAEQALVEAHLPEHIRLTLAEAGCLRFRVTPSPDTPLVWLVDEEFVDSAAFAAHQARTRASAWFAATQHIARAYQTDTKGE